MKHKTSELEGATLDAVVGMCEGVKQKNDSGLGYVYLKDGPTDRGPWQPHKDWSIGGPIIERERITIGYCNDGPWKGQWFAQYHEGFNVNSHQIGSTPLIAAMRSYVAKRIGYTVEIE